MTLRVVLLGGSGFLGGAVLRRLQAHHGESEVHCLVHRRPLPDYGSVRCHRGDVAAMPASLLPAEPHVVVHCASKQVDADGRGFASNLHGINRLLTVKNAWTRAIVYVSSFSVYGDGPQAGVTEDAPLQPQTALARSRVECENRLLAEARAGGTRVAVLRARFVFGEGDRHFLPGLSRLARARVRLGSGEQRFSVIDVDDYARVILSLVRHFLDEDRDQAGTPAVFNVGYRQPVSFTDIAEVLCEKGGYRRARFSVPVSNAMVRGLKRFPLGPSRQLADRMQLLGYDHFGETGRLATMLDTPVLDRDPRQALANAVPAMPGASNNVDYPRGF